MAHRNDTFIKPAMGMLLSTNTVVFKDSNLINVESKELMSVWNAGKRPIRVRFVPGRESGKFAVPIESSVLTLRRGMGCEFDVLSRRCAEPQSKARS